MKPPGRLVVVSNRLPITVKAIEHKFRLQQSSGGLVSALLPVLRERSGCWVGWTGTEYHEALAGVLEDYSATQNYSVAPIFLDPSEKEYFYNGCANEVIWPLFHGLPSRCLFDAAYWHAYRKTNGKFAEATMNVVRTGDFIWVHDYHLMMVAKGLRARGLTERLAYFHHIPFPSPDVFEVLPWRTELLRALLLYDVIGFQTRRDRQNFTGCLRRCLRDVHITDAEEGLRVEATGCSTLVQEYPISIDFDADACEAAEASVVLAARAIRERLSGRIVLGVDRLDYTKGIVERLLAFRTLLECHPELRNEVTLIQLVVPSREDIAEYKQLRLRIETLVSTINGEYGTPGWIPVQYFYRCLKRAEVLAYYRAAHAAFVTPLRDGMNLVAKEFCAARNDYLGVLVLSEFAGAAQELADGALIVNPNDSEGMAAVLYLALHMDEPEQRARMLLMRSHIRHHNVFRWSDFFVPQSQHAESAVTPFIYAAR